MKETVIIILTCVVIAAVILVFIIIPLEQRLDDCHFECNHLQVRLY